MGLTKFQDLQEAVIQTEKKGEGGSVTSWVRPFMLSNLDPFDNMAKFLVTLIYSNNLKQLCSIFSIFESFG